MLRASLMFFFFFSFSHQHQMKAFQKRQSTKSSPTWFLSTAQIRWAIISLLDWILSIALQSSKMVANWQHVFSGLLWNTRRKKRMQVSSVKWSTTVSEKAFLFSITPTTGNACTNITCSPWWPSSSSTSPWTQRSAWSAKCSGKTFITATRIATRDDSMLKSVSWPNQHDLWTEYLLSLLI